MRFSINLASEPYENLRPLRSAVALLALLAVVLSLTLAWKAQHNRRETRVLAEQSDRLDRDLVNLRREQGDLTQKLLRPEVQTIRDRSNFLNSLIIRKSLSWSQLFMDLEKVLPDQVQVATIRPSHNESAQAQVNLTVLSMTVAPLVEFLKNLESSPQFAKPVVNGQRYPGEKATERTIALDLSVLYQQNSAAAPAPEEKEAQPASAKPEKETAAKPLAPIAAARVRSDGKGER
jgi:type IV pilus assembly protein PilN